MKNIFKLVLALLTLSLSIPFFVISADQGAAQNKDMRGLWVATVVNIDYPQKPTTDSNALKSEALTILDNAKAWGMNAVFLQVRPSSDALYKSQIYPWSKYLTGTQGLAPNDGFDPLAFWIDEAHKRGLELHAWINPYRVTKKKDNEPAYDMASLDPSNPARLHPDWVVKYPDGNLYFNPGLPEVRKLIADSITEIINNYSVDGIHFDDYFYPGNDFNDKDTFAMYGGAYSNIDDWRRDNVNTLVSDVSKAIKATGKSVRFGISPFGIWANKSQNPLGSDTKGAQTYYDHYADAVYWVRMRLVDYIAPQLYWNIGFSAADYSKLLTWWKDTVNGTGVDLYIGQAAYRTAYKDPSSPWYGISELDKQLRLNTAAPEVKGSIFFSYKSFADNPALGPAIKAFYQQKDGALTIIPVKTSRPSEDIKTSYSRFYLNGSSDPAKPLYLNGSLVSNRSGKGYFGILVPLNPGPNIFTFSQEGSYSTRVIYRYTSSVVINKMSSISIPAASVFPQATEYRMPGEKILLTCQAPIGSKVTVKIGGKRYTMKPSSTIAPGTGAYPTSYTYVYTIPSYKGTPRVVDLGPPVYTMTYKKTVRTRTAPAKVGVVMNNAPFYARVIKDVADTYKYPSTGYGAAYELYKGMTDYVTGMTDSYVRLSSGQWLYKSSVSTYTSKTQLKASIKNAEYSAGEKLDTLKLDLTAPAAALADFDGSNLKLEVSAAVSGVAPVLPDNAMFSAVTVSKTGGKVQYILKLKAGEKIDGYYIEKTDAGLNLNVKRHLHAVNGSLSGITIMVDPGHGGNEYGAIGPLGTAYAEKTINLNTALKLKDELEKLGAAVIMTRTDDRTVSLGSRLAASRNARPDMFISVHANAMEDNIDVSQIFGFQVHYREEYSKQLAQTALDKTLAALNRNNRGIHTNNFYVLRGTWTPSILLESGFVPNPSEFEGLTDEYQQTLEAQGIAQAVLDYFTN